MAFSSHALMLAVFTATPYQVHVSAAKAAVDALSSVLAIEEGPHGVRSNVLAPGPVANTEGADRLSNKSNYLEMKQTLPLGRVGAIEDCANAGVCEYLTLFLLGWMSSH